MFRANNWVLWFVVSAVVLIPVLVLAVTAESPLDEEPDSPVRVRATATPTPFTLPSLGVSRDEIVDLFEDLGFTFQDEVFGGILGAGPIQDAELSMSGSQDGLHTITFTGRAYTRGELELVVLYMLALFEVVVPTWDSDSWIENMLDSLTDDEGLSFLAHPVPGVEVSLFYYPPPPAPLFNLQVLAFDE